MLGTYFGALIILAGVLVIARKDIRLKGGKRDKRNLSDRQPASWKVVRYWAGIIMIAMGTFLFVLSPV